MPLARQRLRALLAALVVTAAGQAAGQEEVDRAIDLERSSQRGGIEDEVGPVRSLDAVTGRPGPGVPRYLPEPRAGFDPSLFPDATPPPAPPAAPAPVEPGVELSFEGHAGARAGWDSNVFRAERGRTQDSFFHGDIELELLTRFPQGSEVFVELSGETQAYLERERANEHFVSSFVEYFQPVAAWMDLGLQNAIEWSRLNLLDDNGDLFPRGRFGSFDEEVRVFAILRPPAGDVGAEDPPFRWRDLAFEVGASYRLKNYEENTGLESLDYEEMRFDGSVGYKLARRPRSRVKLKYRFRRRDYDEFRARERDGTVAADASRLELQRHQVNLTWFQEVGLDPFRGRLIVGVGAVYNRDTHENDRSYREALITVRAEWWLLADWTRLDASVRGVARDFLVRRPAGGGGHLRHRLVALRAGLWQRLGSIPPRDPGRREDPDAARAEVALVVSGAVTVWRSGDAGEDYDRYVVEAGLEVAW